MSQHSGIIAFLLVKWRNSVHLLAAGFQASVPRDPRMHLRPVKVRVWGLGFIVYHDLKQVFVRNF